MRLRRLAVTVLAVLASACREPSAPEIAAPPLFSHTQLGGWTLVGNLATARFTAMAATAADGRIFITGGWGPTSSFTPGVSGPLASVEVYNPATASWGLAAPMPASRFGHAFARGGDGRLYAAGGQVGLGYSGSTIALNPATNTWTTVASMSVVRYLPASTAGPDGKIYVIGGNAPFAPGFYTTTVEVYDPATNTWSFVAPALQHHYAGAAAAGPDGRIYAIGGLGTSGNNPLLVEAYDPAANAWTRVADLPAGRELHSAVTGPDGHIYVIGGYDGYTLSRTVVAYNVATNTWSSAAPMLIPRERHATAVGNDGAIYVFGGQYSAVHASAERTTITAGNQAPVAALGGPYTGYVGIPIAMDASGSHDPDGDALQYTWNFGNGVQTTGGAVTTHAYLTAGQFTVTVTAKDPGGLTGSASTTVTVLGSEDAAARLIELLEEAVASGDLTSQAARRLIAVAEAAHAALGRGNRTAAQQLVWNLVALIATEVRTGQLEQSVADDLLAFILGLHASLSY